MTITPTTDAPLVVLIDRARWTRRRLKSGDCYCTLGWIAKVCGVSDDALDDEQDFSSLRKEEIELLPECLMGHLRHDVVCTNDSTAHAETREKALCDLLSPHGIELRWTGEYRSPSR